MRDEVSTCVRVPSAKNIYLGTGLELSACGQKTTTLCGNARSVRVSNGACGFVKVVKGGWRRRNSVCGQKRERQEEHPRYVTIVA